MSAGRRSAVVIAVLVLLCLVVAGLAVMAVTVLPVVLALGVACCALVAGLGQRRWHRAGRRRAAHRSPVLPDGEHGAPDTRPDLPLPPRWTTRWESGLQADAVPLVRDRLTVQLNEWGLTGEEVEPTLLVVTELLSNAAEHGHCPAELVVALGEESVHVEVGDGGAEPPQPQPQDPLRLRGRGLRVVEALSTEWGWTDDHPGKVVWADVPTAWPH